jgi:predicted ribosomally synthesized peptide with SipW-like signal peptide
MKKILKSFLVLAIVLGSAGSATKAWFTSQVSAVDNVIQVGTLMMALDSTRQHVNVGTWGFDAAYTVVEDIDGVSTQYDYDGGGIDGYEDWSPAAFGLYAPFDGAWPRPVGNFSIWTSVRNRGTMPMNYRLLVNGRWTSMPRGGTGACSAYNPDGSNGDVNIIKVMNIHRYNGAACGGDQECRNIRDGLEALSVDNDPVAGTGVHDTAAQLPLGTYYYGTDDGTAGGVAIDVDADEYVVYRMDLQMDPTGVADPNCYQGATYHYDLVGEAKQTNATW